MQPGYPRHVESLFEWMDNDALKDDIWKDRDFRRDNSDVLSALVSEFSEGFNKMDFYKEAQRRHIPASPLMTIKDLLEDDHLRVRDYFVSLEHPAVGEYRIPGAPFRMGESPWRIYRPAPLLGEHTEDVLKEWSESPRKETPPAAPPEGTDLLCPEGTSRPGLQPSMGRAVYDAATWRSLAQRCSRSSPTCCRTAGRPRVPSASTSLRYSEASVPSPSTWPTRRASPWWRS